MLVAVMVVVTDSPRGASRDDLADRGKTEAKVSVKAAKWD